MAVDVPVLELYGMSESTGPQTISLKSSTRWRTGSCGKDMSGAETKIDNPDEDGNGEVSDVRQSLVMSNMELWHKAVNCLVWVSLC